jgi:tetratricopeptide (TPR) repeat protein
MNRKVRLAAFCISLVLMALKLNAQTSGKPSPAGKTSPPPNKLHERVYLKSKGVGDLASATMSLYYWMEAQPGRKDLLDSLCFIYLARGMFGQSAAVAKEVLKDQKENLPVKEAALQYLSKNFSASVQNLDALDALAGVEKERIILNYQGEQINSQAVPVLAATKNIRGILLMEAGKKQEAEAMFNSALEVFPGFIMAERNLQTLQK